MAVSQDDETLKLLELQGEECTNYTRRVYQKQKHGMTRSLLNGLQVDIKEQDCSAKNKLKVKEGLQKD